MRMISISAYDAALLTQAARRRKKPEMRLRVAILNAEREIANDECSAPTSGILQLPPSLHRLG